MQFPVVPQMRSPLQCGLPNKAVQQRLLAEADLSLTKVFELAQEMEVAEQNAKVPQGARTFCPQGRSTPRPSVRNTKYPGVFGILPSCPPYIHPNVF